MYDWSNYSGCLLPAWLYTLQVFLVIFPGKSSGLPAFKQEVLSGNHRECSGSAEQRWVAAALSSGVSVTAINGRATANNHTQHPWNVPADRAMLAALFQVVNLSAQARLRRLPELPAARSDSTWIIPLFYPISLCPEGPDPACTHGTQSCINSGKKAGFIF